MSRRNLISCLLALTALVALTGAPGAWAKKAATPKITKVSPMRVQVGGTLTIRGSNFKSKAKGNTVIFRASNGRSAFVKPRRASRTKLVLTVTERVARLLTVRDSSQRPTRLKLRVLAGKFSAFTPRRLSPVVVGVSGGGGGGGGGGGAQVCEDDSDHDNDLLSNSSEKSLGTDPCLEDTDSDGMIDGWEYYAAKDLNVKAVPYPGKRPYPNALDPTDGKSGSASRWDFDGDGLLTYEEYRAWRRTGSSYNTALATGLGSPLGYSDGTKFSRHSETPAVPNWQSFAYGIPNPTEAFPSTYDYRAGAWRDDERDADADGLSNWLESARGPGQISWWAGFFGSEGTTAGAWPDPANDAAPCSDAPVQEFGAFDERPFTELDLADGDVDGDALLDGEDDQDFDDVTNIQELYEVVRDLDGDGQLTCGTETYPSRGDFGVNAFNPCGPDEFSRTCDDYKPF